MPIRIVSINGRSASQIFCDHCGSRIADAADGNFLWLMEEDPTNPQEIYFAHKDCTPSVEQRHEGMMGALELHELPVRLAANLTMPVKVTSTGSGFVDYELRGSILALSL